MTNRELRDLQMNSNSWFKSEISNIIFIHFNKLTVMSKKKPPNGYVLMIRKILKVPLLGNSFLNICADLKHCCSRWCTHDTA